MKNLPLQSLLFGNSKDTKIKAFLKSMPSLYFSDKGLEWKIKAHFLWKPRGLSADEDGNLYGITHWVKWVGDNDHFISSIVRFLQEPKTFRTDSYISGELGDMDDELHPKGKLALPNDVVVVGNWLYFCNHNLSNHDLQLSGYFFSHFCSNSKSLS